MNGAVEQEALLLRFDAPLMSFGGVRIDDLGATDEAPGLSLLTGMLANALGYEHRDVDRLERLQTRLRFAVRRDRSGSRIEDYQTVDLGQPSLEAAWTTKHRPAKRDGASSQGTHIRHRWYWADAIFTVALTLRPADEPPLLDEVANALERPERPLFIGRKPCLPAAPILIGTARATTLLEAVRAAPLPHRRHPSRHGNHSRIELDADGSLTAWWPDDDAPAPNVSAGGLHVVYDRRDWANQVHTGRRVVHRGRVAVRQETSNDD